MLIGASLGGYVAYEQTRIKWHELGRKTGLIEGRVGVMRNLCALAIKSAPPLNADYFFDVKASRLSVIKNADGIRLYCQE